MTPELYARCQQALHVLDAEGRLWRGGEACLFILEALGYRRLAACLWRWPLRWLVAAGYAVVARHRRFFSRLLRCAQAPA
ncbi:MAG: hypothetical protein KatS3mg131_4011 [Candidatus Tectimicrobiota bacterium]|nr:MAG: hypothetical protein KatS3mg131_4011 [Candidatus Tectomicrobia bacterium]